MDETCVSCIGRQIITQPSETFLVSWLFASSDRNTGTLDSASVLPVRIQGRFPLRLTGLIFAVQETFRSLLQHHSSKASILWHSAFFTVQLSQLYMTTGKTTALTVRTLLFNTLSRFVIAFLPRSNHLLISCVQSPSTVILEPKNRKWSWMQ